MGGECGLTLPEVTMTCHTLQKSVKGMCEKLISQLNIFQYMQTALCYITIATRPIEIVIYWAAEKGGCSLCQKDYGGALHS